VDLTVPDQLNTEQETFFRRIKKVLKDLLSSTRLKFSNSESTKVKEYLLLAPYSSQLVYRPCSVFNAFHLLHLLLAAPRKATS